MDVSTLLDWRNAVIAMDTKRISAIMSIHQTIVSESLSDIPQDLNFPAKLGNPSTMSALQYTLLTMWSHNNITSANEKQFLKTRKHLVDLLLQTSLSTDLDYQNDHGDTAMHYAAAMDLSDIIASIIARGASPDLKNKDNATAESLITSAQTRAVFDMAMRQRPAIRALRQNSLVSNSVFKQNMPNNPANRTNKARIPEYSSKDRFTELRRLAETSATGSDQKVAVKKDVNNYIRPGMLEQKKKGLSQEEQQREERMQQARRRVDVEQLVTKKAVNTNRFVTERSKSSASIPTPTSSGPSPTSTEPEADYAKFSKLKEKSYVSTSIFRQHSADSDEAEVAATEVENANEEDQLSQLNVGDSLQEEIFQVESNEQADKLADVLSDEPESMVDAPMEVNEFDDDNGAQYSISGADSSFIENETYEEHKDDLDSHADGIEITEQTLDFSHDNQEEIDHPATADSAVTETLDMVEPTTVVGEEAKVFYQPPITEAENDNVQESAIPYIPDDSQGMVLESAFDQIVITPANEKANDEESVLQVENTFLRPRSHSVASAKSDVATVEELHPEILDAASAHWDAATLLRKSSMTFDNQFDGDDAELAEPLRQKQNNILSDSASMLDVSFPSSNLNFEDEMMTYRSLNEPEKQKELEDNYDRDHYGSISVANTSTYPAKQSGDASDVPTLPSFDTHTVRSSSASVKSSSSSNLKLDTKNITFSKSTGLTNLSITPSIRRKPVGGVPEKTKSESIPRSKDRIPPRQGSYAVDDDDDVPLSASARKSPSLFDMDSSEHKLPSIRPSVSHLRGKLLVRICRFNIEPTLIMPKDPLHIRCILTDGRNEYQSQYTPLGQEIDINQGCLISAYPDMKFRLSLQARPDAHVKPKKQLTRLLSTAAKKPINVVTNMINKEDGHFGQTRIQLRSVAHLCRNSLYTAAFDCYNNWSMVPKTSSKASAVRDNLVVVGNLVLQLYFIPHVEGTRLPNTVKECEAGLDIKRWYCTTWLSGDIAIRKPDEDLSFRKRYAQVVGAKLYIQRDMHDTQKECVDLKTIKVITADKQVLAKGPRKPERQAGSASSRLAEFVTSEDIIDEEDSALYSDMPLTFRCTFTNGSKIDIKCETSAARDRWLKAVKGVLNKAPTIPGWLVDELSDI
ncbi:hypothetical protein INT43_005737 [Umbelopsis isabellina]|uniref:PH domain-containing protein n=1 Tax=Mortierella isabellina TaxID=91625 RepID=A0A8H7UCI0_MORIS|nr:hypothetical protein INT43_005737 [Umbelopsis isabellina]